jgi:hypothetical protein
MDTNAIYEESSSPRVMKQIIGIMGVITLMFLAAFIYLSLKETIGNIPNWFYLIMFLLSLTVTILYINFKRLNIEVTSSAITLRYGMFKSVVAWENIEKCTNLSDQTKSSGGIGLYFTRRDGTWVRSYNLMNNPRIELDLKTGKSRKLIFSTENPDRIIEIADQMSIPTS